MAFSREAMITRASSAARNNANNNSSSLHGSPPTTRTASTRRFTAPSVTTRRSSRLAASNSNLNSKIAEKVSNVSPPARLKNDLDDDVKEEEDDPEKQCCICLEEPSKAELSTLDGCNHRFCFSCIEKWSERENRCPLCKTRFHEIKRLYKQQFRKKRKGSQQQQQHSCKNSKRVKNRDQRADLPFGGNALQGFFASLERSEMPSGLAQLIFSAVNNSNVAAAAVHQSRGGSSSQGAAVASSASNPFFIRRSGAPGSHYTGNRNVASSNLESMTIGGTIGVHGNGELSMRFHVGSPGNSTLRSRNSASAMAGSPTTNRNSAFQMFMDEQLIRPQQEQIPRSYAVNREVANAGSQDVPLEIASDSDNEIEVVSVRQQHQHSSSNNGIGGLSRRNYRRAS